MFSGTTFVDRTGHVMPGQRASTPRRSDYLRRRSVSYAGTPHYSYYPMPTYTPPRSYEYLSSRYNPPIPLTSPYSQSALGPLIGVIAALALLVLFLPLFFF